MGNQGTIKHPFGAATTFTATATGAQAVSAVNSKIVFDGVTTSATGNRTINVTADTELEIGSEMIVQVKTDGTETTTFGTGITAPVITGVAGKTFSQNFTYNGTVYTPDGEADQID